MVVSEGSPVEGWASAHSGRKDILHLSSRYVDTAAVVSHLLLASSAVPLGSASAPFGITQCLLMGEHMSSEKGVINFSTI